MFMDVQTSLREVTELESGGSGFKPRKSESICLFRCCFKSWYCDSSPFRFGLKELRFCQKISTDNLFAKVVGFDYQDVDLNSG